MPNVAVPECRVGKRWGALRLGHFTDEAAFGRFVQAYVRGMQDLPVPVSSTDVHTRLGVVWAYRFGSAPGTPMVLLPGRNASTPMWRANLASLIARRSVYSLDLLGEAGMSVQLNGEFPERISDVTHRFLDDIDRGARGAHSL